MQRFLRWLLGIPDVIDVAGLLDVRRDLDEIRDSLEHLDRRFTKLQRQVTRAWREEVDEGVEEDYEEEER